MGYYVNPQGKTKETWLKENGEQQIELLSWSQIPAGKTMLCWIDNRAFSALGVCFSEDEYKAFQRNDGRQKGFWFVSTEKVLEEVPELEGMI